MRNINILAIAPYAGLKDYFINSAKSFSNINLDVFTGNLQGALQNIKAFQDKEYDIVISRGGTAQMLKESLGIPVVEVEVSVYDMLRVIKTAQQSGKEFAIMGFSNVTKASAVICDILKYEIPIFEINSEEEARESLADAAKSNIELIIGDVVTTDLARQAGINNLLITSGPESVEKVLRDSISLFQSILKAQHSDLPYKYIVDRAMHGVLIFDENKMLKYSNSAFNEMGGQSLESSLQECIGRLDVEKEMRLWKKWGNMQLDITGIKIPEAEHYYFVFYVSGSAKSASINPCVHVENPADEKETLSPLFVGSESVRAMIDKVHRTDSNRTPILIYGEAGTGVEAFARYIHITSIYKALPFIVIDCETLTEKRWQDVVDSEGSPLSDRGCTAFFSNVHLLSLSMQRLLDTYIDDTLLLKRHHVISSSASNVHALVADGSFLHSLYLKLCGITAYMPSLNERPEDIPALASLYISQYNMEFAKQVIGFDDEALELLKNFNWELNQDQLQRAIRQLVIITDKSYISAKDVKMVLIQPEVRTSVNYPLDFSKSLDEIERDIINYVIIEEDMNQSRAAKRLCISRSTMWRKTKPAQLKSAGYCDMPKE